MEEIAGPQRPLHHPNREADCQAAARSAFHALAARIEAAGWLGDEAAVALLSLAMAHLKSRYATEAERPIPSAVDGRNAP